MKWNGPHMTGPSADAAANCGDDIHKAFTQWCRGNNNHSISNQEFQHELAEYLGVDENTMTKRSSKGIIYKDYTQ